MVMLNTKPGRWNFHIPGFYRFSCLLEGGGQALGGLDLAAFLSFGICIRF